MGKEAIERMPTSPNNAYYHRWHYSIARNEKAIKEYVYQPEWQRNAEKAVYAQEILDEVDEFLREGRRRKLLNRPKKQQEEEEEIVVIDESVSWCHQMLNPERAWLYDGSLKLWSEECYVATKMHPGRGFDSEE